MDKLQISALFLCDDAPLLAQLTETLKPVLRSVVGVSTHADAVVKALNQEFELVILRTSKPTLDDPKGFYHWSQGQKTVKNAAWIVLGSDVESKEALIDRPQLKFLENFKDGAELAKLIQNLFYKANTKSGASLDVNFINPIVKAILEVTDSMGGVKLQRGKPFLKKPNDPVTAEGDISGIIAMNSNRFVGSLAICFQDRVIFEVYKNMLGTVVSLINDEVKDAVAELTNIIFGNAKRDLNAEGHTIAQAIPSVVTGRNHQIRHSVKGHCICIPFESPFGKVIVEYVIAPAA